MTTILAMLAGVVAGIFVCGMYVVCRGVFAAWRPEGREQKATRLIRESGKIIHANDCATSVAPAEEPGPCDCIVEGQEVWVKAQVSVLAEGDEDWIEVVFNDTATGPEFVSVHPHDLRAVERAA